MFIIRIVLSVSRGGVEGFKEAAGRGRSLWGERPNNR